ncbi:unnamed protein product [Rotaria magnacalcarata]
MDIKELNIIAVRVIIEDQQFVVASIYSPPADQFLLASMSTLLKHSKKQIIIVGDLNATHHAWGCPQALDTKLLLRRTYWKLYTYILITLHDQLQAEQESAMNDPHNTYKWFLNLQQFLVVLKLRDRFRHSKKEKDRLRLRTWNILIKQELQAHRQRSWEQFISSVASSNPTTFWHTVKKLNKNKSVEVSAITEKNIVHRSPEDIVMNLAKHFAERHAEPLLDMTKILDKEASELWQLYSTADKDDIKLLSNRSDLRFSEADMTNTFRSLKSENSSEFDQVSKKMIKEIPEHFHVILPHAYSQLFSAINWDNEWKLARTICLNKSDNPVPTTNQLRPISMLPVFSKVYEKLFLLRFNRWTIKMNILPGQQYGARSHQATTSPSQTNL